MSEGSAPMEKKHPLSQNGNHQTSTFPFHPANVANLYLRPSRFFNSHLELDARKYLILAGWIYGIIKTINQIDEEFLRAELGRPRARQLEFASNLAGSWIEFWFWMLFFGGIGAIFYWYIGGWWFRKRAEWSGGQSVDSREARTVYIFTTLIISLPLFLIHLIQVAIFPDYAAGYTSGGFINIVVGFLAIILPYWSLIIGYKAARTKFEIFRGKGLFWFVILPGTFYTGGNLLLFIFIIGAAFGDPGLAA